MMSNVGTCTVVSWLEHLLLLFPPSGVLLIGAGAGTGQWIQWLQRSKIPNVTLLEPDDVRFERLLLKSGGYVDWRIRKMAVASSAQPATFYLATLSGESALVQPEDLRTIWPNIATLDKVTLRTTTVAELQGEASLPSSWLVVDCFPALPIIHGAANRLEDFDVILLRAVIDDPMASEAQASESELIQYMTKKGYRHLKTALGRNPKLGHALFVRDIRETMQSLQNELTSTKQELHAEVHRGLQERERLRGTGEAHAQLAQNRASEIERLKQCAAVAAYREEELETQLHALREAKVLAEQLARDSFDTHQEQRTAEMKTWESERASLQQDLEMMRKSSAASHAKVETLERQLRILALSNEVDVHLKSNADRDLDDLVLLDASKNPSGGDAEIHDLIQDIAPFFYGKSITYVDVGAFVGEVFLKLRKFGDLKIREAHLIEPNPTSFRKLMENVQDSKIPTLHCYNVGVAAESGMRTFMSAGSMTKIVDSVAGNSSAMGNAFSVECRMLDSFQDVFTDSRIDILKIDVEGRELDVLAGAADLLSRQAIDFIYLEVGFNVRGTQQTYFGSLDAVLQRYDYRVFRIYEQKNEWQKDSPWLRRCNVAYMSKQFAEANRYNASKELYSLRKKIDALKMVKASQ